MTGGSVCFASRELEVAFPDEQPHGVGHAPVGPYKPDRTFNIGQVSGPDAGRRRH